MLWLLVLLSMSQLGDNVLVNLCNGAPVCRRYWRAGPGVRRCGRSIAWHGAALKFFTCATLLSGFFSGPDVLPTVVYHLVMI